MNAGQALNYLRDKASEFADVENTIINLQRKANAVQVAARDAGDLTRVQLAKEANVRLRDTFEKYRAMKAQWYELTSKIPQGLGALPVILAGAVIALAGGVVWILARVEGEDRIIRMLEEGTLTTDEAQEILEATEGGGFPQITGNLMSFAAYALAGFLAWKMFQSYGKG